MPLLSASSRKNFLRDYLNIIGIRDIWEEQQRLNITSPSAARMAAAVGPPRGRAAQMDEQQLSCVYPAAT
jgi:hypothetical protein